MFKNDFFLLAWRKSYELNSSGCLGSVLLESVFEELFPCDTVCA